MSAPRGASNARTTPPPNPAEPTQEIGEYIIHEVIGKGSFGKVKRATHKPTGMTLAIKVLSRQKLASSNMDRKIRREIKILKLFRHHAICRIYDVIYTATDIFLVMEHVDGGELYDFIVKQGVLKEDYARYIFQQIVCALEYCHHFRVIHRDLKPENILLGTNLQVKIIDFGLSNLMQDGEFLKTSCGSPNYAAPEVISGRLYAGPEVDVWSCGVVLYALVCGCLPFDEETIPALFQKIKRGKFQIPAYVSPEVRDLIEQLIVVDPLARITIPQIRDHPWFTQKLPRHLHYNEALFAERDEIVPAIEEEAVRTLAGTHPEARVRAEIAARVGPAFVTYNILLDRRRAQEIASVGAAINNDVSGAQPTCAVRASERELNLGLALAASPVMQALFDFNDAYMNKDAYNSGAFMPASAQEARSVPPLRQHAMLSPGSFCFVGGASQQQGGISASMQAAESLAARTNSGSVSGSSLLQGGHDRPRLGSVAKTESLFTVEEQYFILQNNLGWRVGIMTDQRSSAVLHEVYTTLLAQGMEWKVVSPFHLAVRFARTPALSETHRSVSFQLIMFRLQEKHERGFLIDFRIMTGNTILVMDIVDHTSRNLLRRIG